MRFPVERVEARAHFDEFFEEEHERLFKVLYFVTGNRQDAEDVIQDAFMKLGNDGAGLNGWRTRPWFVSKLLQHTRRPGWVAQETGDTVTDEKERTGQGGRYRLQRREVRL